MIRRAALWTGVALALTMPVAAQDDADPVLCRGREDCHIVGQFAAGRDELGRELTVREIAIGRAGQSPALRDAPRPCNPYQQEFWLLTEGVGPRLILDLCNDGYGAAGIGDDEVMVRANRLIHRQNGGSAWRWTETRRVQLSPLRVLSSEGRGFWTVGPNEQRSRMDWTSLQGRVEWWAPACDARGAPPADPPEAPARLPYAFTAVPRFTAGAAPDLDQGVVELGGCAALVNAGGQSGFVTRGAVDDDPDEWMRVAMADARTLLVTVGGRRWTRGAANWIHNDNIELWVGPRISYSEACVDPRQRPRQWGIGIADGQVRAGFGDPPVNALTVERRARATPQGDVVSFRIRLAADIENFTAALAIGDGRRQVRQLATSRLRFGVAATLGEAILIPGSAARCHLVDGRLDIAESGRADMLAPEAR